VVTALTALGDWHRFSGAHELARQAYEEALQKGTATQTVYVCIKLADLYSDCERPDLALSALQPLVRTIRELPLTWCSSCSWDTCAHTVTPVGSAKLENSQITPSSCSLTGPSTYL
jgi:hypothetical protein